MPPVPADWRARAARSRTEPMKKQARTLRKHRELILNWFRAKRAISTGTVEGLNSKAKLALGKAYEFKNPENADIALDHQLGDLPEPKVTREFC